MGWFRSDEMTYVSLIFNHDAAHACVHQIGKLGTVQFIDLNAGKAAFQRRFVGQIRRCDELERKLRYFETELKNLNVEPQDAGDVDTFLAQIDGSASRSASPTPGTELTSSMRLLDDLEATLADRERQLLQLTGFYKKIEAEFNVQRERDEVLKRAHRFYSEHAGDDGGTSMQPSAIGLGSINAPDPGVGGGFQAESSGLIMRFTTLTGVLCAKDVARFERMVFRVTRGNCYLRMEAIDQPLVDHETGDEVSKTAFTAYFKSELIGKKVKRVCSAFRATMFEMPSTRPDDIRAAMQANSAEMLESDKVLQRNRDACVALARDIGWRLSFWQRAVRHEKLVYHTLNCFGEEVSGMLCAEAWVTTAAMQHLRGAVQSAHSSAAEAEGIGGGLPFTVNEKPRPWPTPPTHFAVNKFSAVFQATVDTYGVARYREINPALFTAVTFPFLFGVMYGDIGHGTCLLLVGLWLVLTERHAEKDNGELLNGLYFGRYMILLMGIFAVYAGWLYNDFFSLGVDAFGSKWVQGTTAACDAQKKTTGKGKCSLFPIGNVRADGNALTTGGEVYPFGIDPAWHGTDNELLFYNSLKMKLSVTLGVTQMMLGIFMKGWNALHFGEPLDFVWEFVPQLVFACSIFGYLIVMIFVKWSIDWNDRMGMATNAGDAGCPLKTGGVGMCQPPSIIATLIDMVLKPGEVKEPMYTGQAAMQSFLLTCAMLSVPAMLLVKPLLLRRRAAAQKYSYQKVDLGEEEERVGHAGGSHGHGHGHGGEFNFGEAMIHQGIETIEFVLGMVSNTASYLRLWALSLAHSQLAKVFWEKIMIPGIDSGSVAGIVVAFGIFAAVTFAVLLAMDVLECYLHALRLHWVEFQNKFYAADGHKFEPFAFRVLLKNVQTK